MTVCVDCKFAAWKRTKHGRLHPDGSGRCTWSAEFKIAKSARGLGYTSERGDPITVKGGHIWRNDALVSCDVYERAEP